MQTRDEHVFERCRQRPDAGDRDAGAGELLRDTLTTALSARSSSTCARSPNICTLVTPAMRVRTSGARR